MRSRQRIVFALAVALMIWVVIMIVTAAPNDRGIPEEIPNKTEGR